MLNVSRVGETSKHVKHDVYLYSKSYHINNFTPNTPHIPLRAPMGQKSRYLLIISPYPKDVSYLFGKSCLRSLKSSNLVKT